MPNHGRSGGCVTCKRRRVKCDEARPACSQCRRLGLGCGGYNKKFSFRDESRKFRPAAGCREQDATAQRPGEVVVVAATEASRSLLTGADVAVPFFLVHCAGLGRDIVAARGFFETLIPAYTSQSQDSALSLAVSALAMRVLSLWRRDGNLAIRPYSAYYAQAAAAVRTAVGHPQERRRAPTALAILAMHLYENISAIYDLRQPMPVHHHGVLSLLPIAVPDGSDGLIGTYAQNFVLHLEISSALRQKRSVQPDVHACMLNTGSSTMISHNISSALDFIGAYVADLQADYKRALAPGHLSNSSEHRSRDWITEAARINDMLGAWARSMPNHWRPLRLISGRDFSPSIPSYQLACDIYPSCQLATIWNLWRIQRIILLKIIIGSAQLSTTSLQDKSVSEDVLKITHADLIRELVDGICYSVSFYLGNRTKPGSLDDFTDGEILFPSYHLLATGSTRVARRRQEGDGTAMLKDEHYRHVIANGAWHAMSPLSSLLALFSDNGGQAIATCLEPGQQEWIREQFMRVGILLGLPVVTAKPFGGDARGNPSPSSIVETGGILADFLAERVRKSAIFLSGP